MSLDKTSYLDEVREQVAEGKVEVYETHKQFMEDFIIPQFVDSVDTTATTSKVELTGEDINITQFISWLTKEGFSVDERSSGVIAINYN